MFACGCADVIERALYFVMYGEYGFGQVGCVFFCCLGHGITVLKVIFTSLRTSAFRVRYSGLLAFTGWAISLGRFVPAILEPALLIGVLGWVGCVVVFVSNRSANLELMYPLSTYTLGMPRAMTD